MKTAGIILIAFVMFINVAFCQSNSQNNLSTSETKKEEVKYKHSLGVSLLMISNFFPDPADYYLFTYGYQPTLKDRIFTEFNTWKYAEPIGTYENSDEMYPGYVRTYGIGFGYQRFHWRGVFTTVQATPFLKQYFDEQNEKIQNGFQLYLQFVAGYRFEFFKKRVYVEPAYALKWWPVDTNFPEDFAAVEEGAPNYIFEPSLNFGFKF